MKKAAIVVAQALGTFSILATALPLLDASQWYVRVFDYPRVQLITLALLSLALFLWLGSRHRKRDKLLLVGLGSAILYQTVSIFPYTLLAPVQVKQAKQDSAQENELSIMVSNVLMSNEDHAKLGALVRERQPPVAHIADANAFDVPLDAVVMPQGVWRKKP